MVGKRDVFEGVARQEHPVDGKGIQIVQQQEIGPKARGHGTATRQAEIPGRIDGGHGHGRQRGDPLGDGLAHEAVQVPFPGQIHRIRSSLTRDIVRVFRADKRDEGVQILFGAALADHDVHPQAQLFPGLVQGGAFVVRGRSGQDIGVQGPAPQTRRMAVDGTATGGPELTQNGLVPSDHARNIHDLGQPEQPVRMPGQHGRHILRLKACPGRGHVRRRHARRSMK
jgi:hypothetical protein